jgi:hypothetical protein
MDSQYNDQKKHGQAIQRPKETWTGNIATKKNMDRIVCPCFFWSLYCLSMFLLVFVLSVHVSFGRYIACPCFCWSLYCLSMFLLVVVLSVHVSLGRCKHGQAIQRPKETWTDNTTTKRNMDRQYNYQKKHGQAIQRPKETWTGNTCLSMFLLEVVLSVHVSFGRCIVCPCFFWSLQRPKETWTDNTRPKETWTGNTKTKRNMDRQYNDKKKHGQTIQRPKETWTDNTTTKRNMDRQYNDQKKHGQAIQPCFFWSLYCLSMFLLVVVLSVHDSFGKKHGGVI